MIQFNLMPDVKLEFVRAQQMKRLVVGTALIATITSFVLFALLYSVVHGVQHKNMNDLNKDIAKYTKQLQDTTDLNKILTVQNQLGALTTLHDQKPAASRVFTFIQQVTPANVTIGDLATDFTAHTMTITGTAPSLDAVNTFIDSLKFATYSGGGESGTAFSSVVMSQFAREDTSATYTITLNFDPNLFTNEADKTLNVPNKVTTRSVLEQPSAIFQKVTTNTGVTGQ